MGCGCLCRSSLGFTGRRKEWIGGAAVAAVSRRWRSEPHRLLSLTPVRAAGLMSSSSPPPPEEEKNRKGGAAAQETPNSPSVAPPLPPPPEAPLPGDCCGSGCVRCVWDVYYEELEAYNKLSAERMPEAKTMADKR
ncbi:unnamed protein product [Spirodela intermedia]|uniref:Oxidoreductase-like domain-containing protein n=1 Tax=Spirodela intermedia TaxID=51605 RepID=A0A7I8KRW7_SPIIN|nr:unnamed protein product [Spirodela intermedia]